MNEATYILMWSNEGLESVVNATEEDQKKTWSVLADQPDNSRNIAEVLYYMTMRARFNTQRHYEIYAVDTDGTITAEDFWKMFEESPQSSAELIRERGRLLHSDRAKSNSIKIT